MTKLTVMDAIRFLQSTAENRNTKQGLQVYQAFVLELDKTETDVDVNRLLRRLNGTLASIESHGEFTGEEYVVVLKLRELEASLGRE